MEVTVLEAQNTPKKPVIAVRTGPSLKHVELALNAPFHVPRQDFNDDCIKVSLYEQLGTQTISDADEIESVCNVPVRAPDGKCSQVKLRIRRGQAARGLSFKSSIEGAEEYLHTHQLEARIQSLFEIVLKRQPPDPYRCMIKELQKIKTSENSGASNGDSTAPMLPLAPSEPPPKSARPSPGLKGRSIKSSGTERRTQEEIDTEAALREVMKQHGDAKESSSLQHLRSVARSGGAQALSNLELAHEVMRIIIRQIVAGATVQSSSSGSVRVDNRIYYTAEHAKNRVIAHHVISMAVRGAHGRLFARSLGVLEAVKQGAQSLAFSQDPVDWAECAKSKALTETVVKTAIRKVSTVL